MRKIRLDKKGLSGMVAVIVLLTLVLVLGAIIAGTLSGAPRPVMPATTAVNIVTQYGGNPAAGDYMLVIRHEYGQVIDDAIVLDKAQNPTGPPFPINIVDCPKSPGRLCVDIMERISNRTHWNNMELKINGKTRPVALVYLTVGSEVKVNFLSPDLNFTTDLSLWVWPRTEAEAGAMDFAKGDWMVVVLVDPDHLHGTKPLESGDRIQLLWRPRDLMLVEYLVQ